MEQSTKGDKLSKKQKNKRSGRKIMSMRASFSGPIPHPAILDGYEKACPGAADRIIKMAELQSRHRQSLEKSVIKSNIKNEKTGMVMAFLLTTIMMVAGVYLILNDKNFYGFAAIFGPAIFHAGNYVYNKRQENKISSKPDKKK